MPKDAQVKLTVSIATFDEINAALEQQGFKLGTNVAEIVLTKGTELKQPIDFRLATIRRDCANLAARVCQGGKVSSYDFINFTNEVFGYVLNGAPEPIEQQPQANWK